MQGFVRGGYPPAGSLYVDPLQGAMSDWLRVGALVVNGVYVAIQTYGTPPTTPLEIARALTRP